VAELWESYEHINIHQVKLTWTWILTDYAELFDGAPVGLQIMGRRLEEEKVIGMMKVIAEALQEYEGKSSNLYM